MFYQLTVLGALCASLVSALTVDTPTNVISASPVNITWTTADGDPAVFSIELRNEIFRNQFAIANNVNSALGGVTLTLPSVPAGDGYQIDLINIGDNGDIYAQSALFAIAELPSSSGTASSTGTGATSIGTLPTIAPTLQTTAGGTTGGATDTASATVGSSTSFNNGAAALGISGSNVASYALMLVAALVGAGFVAL